jgi:hypothetical protein
MSNKHSETHWGKWILDRARVVGLLSHEAIASAVGCSPNHIHRFIAMNEPPKLMSLRINYWLCVALCTTPGTLFHRYLHLKPEDAPILDEKNGVGRCCFWRPKKHDQAA